MNQQLSAQGIPTFEEIKQTNEHQAEYWSARDLQVMLGYSQWRRFEDAIKRAMTSCETPPCQNSCRLDKKLNLGGDKEE